MTKENKTPTVFLDRDGVLNKSEVRGRKPYAPRSFEDFEIYPEAFAALEKLKNAGYQLIVVTNQPDVGNGVVAQRVVEKMNAKLMQELPVDAVYACFHSQSEGCTCRKPGTGMFMRAVEEFGADLNNSFMVGDRFSDIKAGENAGCKTIFIDRHYSETPDMKPDYTVQDITDAVGYIL